MEPTAGMEAFVAIWVVFLIIGLLLTILWIALPFAVFGIKPLLRDILKEVEALNRRIVTIEGELRNSRPPK